MTDTKPSVFISYARKDDYLDAVSKADEHTYHLDSKRSFTRQMYTTLTDAGFDVWWDREKMPNRGLTFLDEIKQAIRECDYLIYVSGENALKSDYVRAEWQFALKLCKPIVPVVRQGDYNLLPPEISMGNAPDMREMAHFDDKMDEVMRLISDKVAIATLHNVPSLPDWYIERGDDVQDLQKALRADSVSPVIVTSKKQTLTVQGMGGLGKTTMATALCRLCDVRYRFPDGVFWIEIGKTPSIPTRQADIGVSFGDVRDQYADVQRGKSRLSAILQDKRALIVLDDVWDHQHVEAFRVNAPQSRILVTTRNRGMHTYLGVDNHEIDTLTAEEGVALISKRLGQTLTAEHPQYDDAVAIVDLLGGHTLAISIASARISERGVDAIPRFLQRLQDRKNTGDSPLGDLNMHDADKNYNLELSLAESYEDLSDERKAQFRALGVFAEDSTFDLPALQAVWNIADEWDAEDVIDDFLRLSLLTPSDDDRYELHGLLRDYARALCDDEQRHLYSQRHFDYYHSEHGNYKLNQAYAEDGSMLRHDIIDVDWENILSAIAWDYEHHTKKAVDWVDCVQNFMLMRRTNDERLTLLTDALAIAEANDDQHGQADILQSLGDVLHRKNEYDNALQYYQQALQLYKTIGSRHGQANTLHSLGDVFYMQDDYDNATHHYQRVLSLFETIGDRHGQANTLRSLGDVFRMKYEYDHATQHYQQALPLFETIGDRLGQANTLYSLGDVFYMQDEYDDATQHYQQALQLYETIGSRRGQAHTLKSLGDVLRTTNQYDDATQYYRQALQLYETIGDRLGQAHTLKSLGNVFLVTNQYDDATQYYRQALQLYETIGDRLGQANTLKSLGDVFYMQDEYDDATQYYQQALPLFETIGSRLGQANTLQSLSDVLRMTNQYDDAIQYYQQALQLGREIGDFTSQLNSLRGLAYTYHAQDQLEQACDYASQLLKLAESHDFFRTHPLVQGWRNTFQSWGCEFDD
ncbi:MAG: tetratricopeptide repeat protein [Chloroflexota bacterium]